jgi:hypothetical protein
MQGQGQNSMRVMTAPKSFRRCALAILFGLLLAQGTHAQTVVPGSEAQAREYYGRISSEIGFQATPSVTTLDNLLDFMGYPVSGAKLESLDPAILMDPVRVASPDQGLGLQILGLNGASLRDGDILATRFFAPKITNVNVAAPLPGWRKLVRLRARPDSRAARAGIQAAVILFNFFANAASDQPFSGPSVNTQVMLLAPSRSDRLYWLDFQPDLTLGLQLNASFDAADLPDGASHPYFVPDGCNDCHGSPGNLRPPMLNYLDSDHWFDSLDDDFASLKTAGTPLLFDAHTNDASQPSFTQAFDVIRRFNEEALAQNAMVQPRSFEAQAARTWLKLHAQSDEHFAPVSRGFSLTDAPVWQPSEAGGLAELNRYCFRCHGSVRFSVFDRAAVLERAGIMRQRISPSLPQLKRYFKMPPDRTLSAQDLQMLDDFLKNLK